MLNWEQLLNPHRRKSKESMGTAVGRTELERDYDRILFAAPTRRLADKTQVFPMEKHDSVRNRLTHSHEVSNLARSIGVKLAFDYPEKVFGSQHEKLGVKRNIPSVLAAVGLAHDLGNPPFGHQGEVAIQQWFKSHARKEDQSQEIDADFTDFDGNAQTFRLLTRLQVLNDEFGLNLTVGTLAALIKYPSVYGTTNKEGEADKGGFKKFGVFLSEKSIVEDVWEKTGLQHGVRHPLAYVMEACDDIAYSIIDAEDTVKKGYASFNDLIEFLKHENGDDPIIKEVTDKAYKKHSEFKNENLSSRELNDISMQMFRVKAIAAMVTSATEVFVENINKIMSGEIDQGFELINHSPSAALCKTTKEFDRKHGYSHRDVLALELKGNNYIKGMMDMLWMSFSKYSELKEHPFERFLFGGISENYRRAFKSVVDTKSPGSDNYYKHQLMCDVVSGMTESFLISKHDELKALVK